MLNSMVILTFPDFGLEILCLGKFVPKNQNCLFDLKSGTGTNLNELNSMLTFSFFYLRLAIPFWGKLSLKIQNCLKRTLVRGTWGN